MAFLSTVPISPPFETPNLIPPHCYSDSWNWIQIQLQVDSSFYSLDINHTARFWSYKNGMRAPLLLWSLSRHEYWYRIDRGYIIQLLAIINSIRHIPELRKTQEVLFLVSLTDIILKSIKILNLFHSVLFLLRKFRVLTLIHDVRIEWNSR